MLCSILWVVGVGISCDTGRGEQSPTPEPTPDLPATIAAAVAQTSSAVKVQSPANPPPTFTPRPPPTPSSSSVTGPSPPVFAPRPTPTPRSPLADLPNGEWLQQENPSAAMAILALPWVADGIEESERAGLQELIWLADNSTVFRTLIARPWVEDGLSQLELSVIERIDGIAYYDVALAQRVANLPWVVDGIEQPEPDVVDSLWTIATSDAELPSQIIALPWVADGVSQTEADVVRYFDYISRDDVGLAEKISTLEWVADEITQEEASAMSNLTYVADYDVVLAARLVEMPWIKDDLDDAERSVIEVLQWIASEDTASATRIVQKSWIADGVSPDDLQVVDNLSHIGYEDRSLAQLIVAMPFLDTLQPSDAAAVQSLASLAWYDVRALREVLAHPTLSKGITNEWAPIVATLYHANESAPALVDVLLDPDQVTQEWRTLVLPQSGVVDLVIIRTGPGAERSMDLLEHSVRSAEEFMSAPLPLNYVGLLFGDAAIGFSGGTNYGTHIVVLPEYDADDGSRAADYAARIIAHEVSHYYWSGNPDWLNEGLAELMAAVSEHARTGAAVGIDYDYCPDADNIALLDRMDAAWISYDYECNYALGGGLFVDLYRELGDRAFREALLWLYQMSRVDDDAYPNDGTPVGIRQIESTFGADNAVVGAAIDRWYHGVAP